MAEGKNNIIIYRDWISTFDSLSDEEAGRLVKHLFRYINDKNPEAPDRLTALLFEPIKQTLKRDLKKYEATCLKNSDNVKLRWHKKDTTVYDRIRPDTKHTDSDSDSDKDKGKNIEKRKSDFENYVYEFDPIKYSQELLKEFCAYWTEKNKKGDKMRFEAEKFFDIGRRLATWSKNNSKFGKEKYEPEKIIPEFKTGPLR